MPQPPPFSWVIFLTLVVIFAASVTTFYLLVRRWTTQRQWVSLAEWAQQRRFRFRPAELSQLPAVLEPLKNHGAQVRLHLSDGQMILLQLQTDPPPGKRDVNRWNVLIQRSAPRLGAAAGLRPAAAPASLLDLLGFSQFPSLAVGHRFAVLATSSSSARAVAESALRTLAPADIGLLLAEDCLVLDFSARPFDPIELDRMIALAQQLERMT